jgi:hypothetical protein
MFENLEYQSTPISTSLLTPTLRTIDIQALLCTPKTPRIREIPNTPDIPTRSSRASTQSWDSRMGPRPSESPDPNVDTIQSPRTPQRRYALRMTRSDRIRVKTALDFNIPFYKIRAKYGFTDHQI